MNSGKNNPEIIGGHFVPIKKIGGGSFGDIYEGKDLLTNEPVAIKIESSITKVPQLLWESKLYKLVSEGDCFAKMHFFGSFEQNNILVMDLLGQSLGELFTICHHHFSLKTVLMLADQMLSCIQYLHSKNFIHRDIKPDNFVIGRGNNSNKLYLIDLGLAKKYRGQQDHLHIPYSDSKSLTGTARYASVSAMRGIEQSRRDDIEGLGYVLIFFLKGSLPWIGFEGGSLKKQNSILKCKQTTSFETLCEGLPSEFLTYFRSTRKLRFSEQPDYNSLRQLFRSLFIKLGYTYDFKFDWTFPNSTPPSSYMSPKILQEPVHSLSSVCNSISAQMEPDLDLDQESSQSSGIEYADIIQRKIQQIEEEEEDNDEHNIFIGENDVNPMITWSAPQVPVKKSHFKLNNPNNSKLNFNFDQPIDILPPKDISDEENVEYVHRRVNTVPSDELSKELEPNSLTNQQIEPNDFSSSLRKKLENLRNIQNQNTNNNINSNEPPQPPAPRLPHHHHRNKCRSQNISTITYKNNHYNENPRATQNKYEAINVEEIIAKKREERKNSLATANPRASFSSLHYKNSGSGVLSQLSETNTCGFSRRLSSAEFH